MRRFCGIKRRCAGLQVSYRSAQAFESNYQAQLCLIVVLAASMLECNRVVLDRTCLGVQELVQSEVVNCKKRKTLFFLFLFFFLIKIGIKLQKNKIQLITSRKIKSI